MDAWHVDEFCWNCVDVINGWSNFFKLIAKSAHYGSKKSNRERGNTDSILQWDIGNKLVSTRLTHYIRTVWMQLRCPLANECKTKMFLCNANRCRHSTYVRWKIMLRKSHFRLPWRNHGATATKMRDALRGKTAKHILKLFSPLVAPPFKFLREFRRVSPNLGVWKNSAKYRHVQCGN